jgi:16S rRNA (cytidine1402-2'-O)-methyltransferase
VLYLVATPIGNLGDISPRALETLRSVNLIAAEDTRVTRKLTSHFEIKTRMIPYHEHSGPAAVDALVRRMTENAESIALVTDAGTPGISDPGVDLVQASIAAGVTVVPIPGPAALIAALTASGLPCARFVFEGFLPRTKSSRLAKLNALVYEERTVILYESPPRLAATLGEIKAIFGADRKACVARELTKKFEEFRRGALSELVAHYESNQVRGECVIVIEGAGKNSQAPKASMPDVDTASLWGTELMKRLAGEIDIPYKDLYKLVAEVKNKAKG